MRNILHLSDLHYTYRRGRTRDHARSAAQAILNLVLELSERGTLVKPLLCLTGDIVNSGEPRATGESDFKAVKVDFLDPLLDALSIEPSDVFVVPGNHEIDRTAIDEKERIDFTRYENDRLCEDDLHSELRRKLDNFFQFAEDAGYNSVTREEPRIKSFSLPDLKLVCLNGLVGSFSDRTEKGDLFVAPTELRGCLSRIEKNAVVLTHHPLSWYRDSNGRDLTHLLRSRSARLLTGHIHDQAIEHSEDKTGSLVHILAGASADHSGSSLGVVWLKGDSNAAAVRQFRFDDRTGKFPITPIESTACAPPQSTAYFKRTEAFFDVQSLSEHRSEAASYYSNELGVQTASDGSSFVAPDLVRYRSDSHSVERIGLDDFFADRRNRIISGEELSGKTSFLLYCCTRHNGDHDDVNGLSIVVDFRLAREGKSFSDVVSSELSRFGLSKADAERLLLLGLVRLWVDNFSAETSQALEQFIAFSNEYPKCQWSMAVRGAQRYMPANAPARLPDGEVDYYEFSAIRLNTALQIVESHDNAPPSEERRAVVERVFRSINNLQAPRSIFYVHSLVDLFLKDGSVEPLNRYLLIENLLSERIRAAHRNHIPGQPTDIVMLEAIIATVAFELLRNESSFISHGNLLSLIDEFLKRKGVLRKQLPPEKVVRILEDSFVLREHDGQYGFLMLSIEDYFLAKHMTHDQEFRDSVMSREGLLKLPSVAEVYIAQNPSDKQRINAVFEVIEAFNGEVATVLSEFADHAREALTIAAPGTSSRVEEQLIDLLGEAESPTDEPILITPEPSHLGKTRRLKFSAEERGVVFLQLGASILGVTRTLDQDDRKKIFEKLRPVILTSLITSPILAEHLAEGGVINYRGINIRAEYKGDLAVPENRYYLILRALITNVLKRFSIWAGSGSFYRAAEQLRAEETDPLIRAALFAQNIEADLSEALNSIGDVDETIDIHILKDCLISQYIEALTLIPLDRRDQERAVNQLVDVIADLRPPQGSQEKRFMDRYKNDQRQKIYSQIGFNQHIGRLMKKRS
ncbi:MAG: metallophosphoesterase [Pseudomonadota bacterium]